MAHLMNTGLVCFCVGELTDKCAITFHNYSGTLVTRTLRENEKQFELGGFELSG